MTTDLEELRKLAEKKDAAGPIWINPATILALVSELEALREAVKPFSVAAGGVFTRNFNASDTLFLKPATTGHAESKITAGDLFKARAALTKNGS